MYNVRGVEGFEQINKFASLVLPFWIFTPHGANLLMLEGEDLKILQEGL